MTTASRSLTTAPWEARSLAACFAEVHHYLGRDRLGLGIAQEIFQFMDISEYFQRYRTGLSAFEMSL